MSPLTQLLIFTCSYFGPLEAAEHKINDRDWRGALTAIGDHQKRWGFRHNAQWKVQNHFASAYVDIALREGAEMGNLIEDDYDRLNMVRVMTHFGHVLADQGDDEGAITRWRMAVCLSESGEPPPGWWGDRTGSLMRHLAKAHERLGQWKDAVQCWRQYSVFSFCGNAHQQAAEQRLYHVLLNRCRAGDTNGAIAEYFAILSNGGGFCCPRHSYWLLQLYRAAGRTQDLFTLLDSFDEPTLREAAADGRLQKSSAEEVLKWRDTWLVRRFEAIHRHAEKGELPELVALCRTGTRTKTSDGFDFDGGSLSEAQVAAESLAKLGIIGVCQCEKSLKDEEIAGCWFVYSLGKNPAPEAFQLLVLLADSERDRQEENIAFAMSFQGEKGRKQLEAWAADERSFMHDAAVARLKLMKKPKLFVPLPPKKGSLPKIYEREPATERDD